ncbi:helix-hairpin-helix domain-containing protein [Dactylosporangium sp. NPDC051484]|uniref:ComEA family DNA-binding protein n=1 Tax=Dactylosporangium sp. NPDC051484 TaxID=3154942 RepID=UPI0034505BE2
MAFNPGSNPTSFGWRLRNSWWVLLTILGLGCLSGSGFLYVGITARRPAWWITGVAYFVLAWSGLVAINRLPQESGVSSAIAVGYFLLWFASIVHALILNGSWLRWRAANRPWFEQRPAAAPATALAPPPVLSPPPVIAPPPVQAAPPVLSPPVAVVEVNSATAAQLAEAGRFDLARAERAVADREARGGFQSVDEFAAAAGLAPHEFARMRAFLTCTPRPRAPQSQPQPGGGRVLDF